ncbi:AAA-domain-containing protein [Phlyctochytrium arcticum]|nr:AAA-domain-containing protein [Phlyctochytrium arcticum]
MVRISDILLTSNWIRLPDLDEILAVRLFACGLVPLSEVILGALDRVSYKTAVEDAQRIKSHFIRESTIIRQSATLGVVIPDHSSSRLEYKVLSALPVRQGVITEDTKIIFSNAKWMSKTVTEPIIRTPTADDDVERLLLVDSDTPDGLYFDQPPPDDDDEEDDGRSRTSTSTTVQIEVLRHRVIPHGVFPKPAVKDDLDAVVWTSTSVLMSLREFSGAWILLETENGSRPCRIMSIDLPSSTTPTIYISPSLFHNLNLSAPKATLTSLRVKLTLPTASQVTVARVACPLTNDKRMLDECLYQLKRWFEARDRMVADGDIITVVVDENRALTRFKVGADDGSDDEDEEEDESDNGRGKRDFAYFKITQVTVDGTEGGSPTAWVDPAQTRIIQAGIVHSRVPIGERAYLGADTLPPPPPKGASSVYPKLHALFSTCLHPVSAALGLHCTVLLYGARGVGKRSIVKTAVETLGIHFIEVNVYDIIGDTDIKTEAFLKIRCEKAAITAPCVLLLRNIDALAKRAGNGQDVHEEPPTTAVLAECIAMFAETAKSLGHPIMLVGTAEELDKVPTGMQALFRHQLLCESPSEEMRLSILEHLTRELSLASDVSLPALAMQTAALVARDLVDLVARAGYHALQRILGALDGYQQRVSEVTLVTAGIAVTADDFSKALDKARISHSDSIGAPKIPNVTWDDVGGLAHVKHHIYDTIQLPLDHPELFASGMKKRSGILLYGPPGTGKTLVAKAVATNFSLNFLSVKGPELLNMYIGESEANVRRVFQRARDARPCVVFFDELDSVAPQRGEKGDSGGVMDRIVSQLLAEIDGMGGGADVFVIGATNRPDLLDPALLRPGRFDKLLYLGVSEDHDSQLNILQALTRKFRLDPDLDLRTVAEACPFHYTGADFYALCTDAMLKAILRTIEQVDTEIEKMNKTGPHAPHPHPITAPYYLEHLASPSSTFVQVSEGDFMLALKELVPSVSPDELMRYRAVRETFDADAVGGEDKKGQGPAADALHALEEGVDGSTTHEEEGRMTDLAGRRKQHKKKGKAKA